MTIEKQILDLTAAINRIGDIMLEVNDPDGGPTVIVDAHLSTKKETKPKRQTAKKETKPEPETPVEQDDQPTAQELQTLCLELVRNTKDTKSMRASIKDTVLGFGASTIPKIDAGKYADLKVELLKLKG